MGDFEYYSKIKRATEIMANFATLLGYKMHVVDHQCLNFMQCAQMTA